LTLRLGLEGDDLHDPRCVISSLAVLSGVQREDTKHIRGATVLVHFDDCEVHDSNSLGSCRATAATATRTGTVSCEDPALSNFGALQLLVPGPGLEAQGSRCYLVAMLNLGTGSRMPAKAGLWWWPARGALLGAALLIGCPALAEERSGWRHGGAGVAEGARPPILGAEDTIMHWKTATGSWSNASPVAFGDMVCVTEEPTTLACYEMASGKLRWSATNLYIDSLDGELRHAMELLLAGLDQDQEQLETQRRELCRLQLELRRTGSDQVRERVEALLKSTAELYSRLDTHSDHRLDDDGGVIGFASPTPVVDDTAIYALFGNGVLSSFTLEGVRRWSIWLGPPPIEMIGNDEGTTASLRIADGVLVVPYSTLSGVEPSSGELLWKSVEYRHFGTPAIARVEGKAIVVTPGGELVDPMDGSVFEPKLAQLSFVGPVAVGNIVYVVGADENSSDPNQSRGRGYLLYREFDGRLSAAKLWERPFHGDRSYSTPLVANGRIVLIYKEGEVQVVDANTGEQISDFELEQFATVGSPSPTLGGNRVVISSEQGMVFTFSFGDRLERIGKTKLEPHLASPLMVGDRMYLRGFDHLYCFGQLPR
jgi:outer membrane protein assembly factor BamB